MHSLREPEKELFVANLKKKMIKKAKSKSRLVICFYQNPLPHLPGITEEMFNFLVDGKGKRKDCFDLIGRQ